MTRMQVVAPLASLRREPQADALLETEALHGERVGLFAEREGWARVRLLDDGYEGYVESEALRPADAEPPSHRIAVLRALVFPGPDIKLPPVAALPFGARVRALDARGDFVRVACGCVWGRHLAPVATIEEDFVAVAERFLGVPYLWGGKTALGIDCSGLVQLALAATGRAAPRDSGPQEKALGTLVAEGTPLARGDLVFWRGHVGILRDPETLLHANGYSMTVLSEPFETARARIAGEVTAVRRL